MLARPKAGRRPSPEAQVFKVIDRVPEIDLQDESGATPPDLSPSVEMRDVSFRYPMRPEVTVLSGFNLMVAAGTVRRGFFRRTENYK